MRCIATSRRKYLSHRIAKYVATCIQEANGEERQSRVYRCEWCLAYHLSQQTKLEYYEHKERYFKRHGWVRRFEESKFVEASPDAKSDTLNPAADVSNAPKLPQNKPEDK